MGSDFSRKSCEEQDLLQNAESRFGILLQALLLTGTSTQNSEYCAALVRARDKDRWLAARYAKSDRRQILMTLYAFHSELRRIPSSVSEPPLGEIRLQWWREALEEIREGKQRARAHPVVSELVAAGLASMKFKHRIDVMIDAAARPLYSEEFTDVADLTGWLRRADGTLDGLGVLLNGGGDSLAEIATQSGTAFALAREGRRWAPLLSGEIMRHARTIATESAPALRKAPAGVAPALLHLSLTGIYAKRGDRSFELTKRLRLFSAMAFGQF